ncbi:uncharacterized protein LOC135387947 [Ornithodoros turicata]|uniref:uncharacterized protein LOC135387947 n=1 Tax=Ornithodoros turicata TaxID=34597 RepID=UPI00313A12ED
MWKRFGIKATSSDIKCCAPHPVDLNRFRSSEAAYIEEFLSFLNVWEQHAKSGGFLSKSTAEGLRVTLKSTTSLLEYLSSHGYRYLMTVRLSQDSLERVFGIIRQTFGPNDHPTPTQFLVATNCFSFYNLAKSPVGCAVSEGIVSSLLSTAEGASSTGDLDALMDAGDLDCVQQRMDSDQMSCVQQKSDSRLIYYVAGYTARKSLATLNCA